MLSIPSMLLDSKDVILLFVRDLSDCKEIVAVDSSRLKELLSPVGDNLNLSYSLAQAIVKAGKTTRSHSLKVSEVYYIIQGEGLMYIDNETKEVRAGQAIYIPPYSHQRIKNTGEKDLIFLCIVDPAWRPEYELP